MESSPQAAEAGPIKPPRTCRRASRCPLLAGCPLHSYGDAAAKAALTTELLWFISLPSHPESPSISFTSHSFPKHLQPLLAAGSRISALSSTIALGTVHQSLAVLPGQSPPCRNNTPFPPTPSNLPGYFPLQTRPFIIKKDSEGKSTLGRSSSARLGLFEIIASCSLCLFS